MEIIPWRPFGELSSFDKGVLKVTLPKVEEAKKKEIEIKVK
jgi:HSP20 family molecular chaperone IbpA